MLTLHRPIVLDSRASRSESLLQWGEHEVDYILLIRAPVVVAPNPDEVGWNRMFMLACVTSVHVHLTGWEEWRDLQPLDSALSCTMGY